MQSAPAGCQCCRTGVAPPTPGGQQNVLLREDGGVVLREDGGDTLREMQGA